MIYPGEDFADAADREYAADRQLDVDEAKRAVSGLSAEQHRIMAAASEGRRVGAWGGSASLNPFPNHLPEHGAWEKARMHALTTRVRGLSQRRLP